MTDDWTPHPQQLALLEWFAGWTPKIHARPEARRWPPGYRAIADISLQGQMGFNPKKIEQARRAGTLSPHGSNDWDVCGSLLPLGLVEGIYNLARLTPRGRTVLLASGVACPEVFPSHAPEVFDDVDLRDGAEPDMAGVAESMSRERLDWHARGSARMTTVSGERFLNGSLRSHDRYVGLRIYVDGHEIVEVGLSFEQLASLLVTSSEVPVTVDRYRDHEGMPQSRPAPPPIQPGLRMRKRLANTGVETDGRLDELAKMVEGTASLSQKRRNELLHLIRIIQHNNLSNQAFVVEQAAEEVSAVVEAAAIVVSGHGRGAPVGALSPVTARLLEGVRGDGEAP